MYNLNSEDLNYFKQTINKYFEDMSPLVTNVTLYINMRVNRLRLTSVPSSITFLYDKTGFREKSKFYEIFHG